MPLLRIQLLGDFYLTYDDRPVNTVNQARVQSLLAYLLLHRKAPQVRQHVAFTFWPDLDEAHARNNLRKMLHQLRHTLPNAEQFLEADANTVQWIAGAPFHLDVADFEIALAQAAEAVRNSDRSAAGRAWETALGCYTGDLLPSCYDDWIAPERERLRLLAYQAGRQLVQLHEEQRNYAAALEVGRRLLQMDPLDEAAYAAIMRLYALNNDRAAALRIYHDCVTILQRELEVEPSEEVQATYKLLLHSEIRPTASVPVSALAGAVTLVGRHEEWVRLRAVWHDSARGLPSLVLITGEAGIGKTRLAEELFEWAKRQGVAVARTQAYAAEGRLAFAPVTEWLRSATLAPALLRLDAIWRSELARLLPELLSQDPDLPPPVPLVETWQRQRFFEALARGVLLDGSPLLLLIDDLQWCDQETLEWLRFLLRFDAGAKLLVVGTARSEEMKASLALIGLMRALQSAGQLHEVTLAPLDAAEVASLAGRVGKRELELAETMYLFRETEGNPLFVVEMVRAGLGAEARQPVQWREFTPAQYKLAPSSLPPKLHAVIVGRLDQLSNTAREVIGVAATIGRAFTHDVLAHACGKDEEAVVDALEELWQRRIIREQGANAYDFSHDKLRDVAYSEISPIQQRRLHRRVAQALEEIHATNFDPDAVCGQVAVHYEQAGLAEQAIPHYQQAAAAARRMLAYEEAIGHLNRGLALIATLPETIQYQQRSLALLMALGTLLSAAKGNAALPVREVYTRALELCRRVGDKGQTFVIQQELRIGYGQRGEVTVARQLAQANLALAHELENHELLSYAHLGMAVVHHTQGELELACQHFEQAIGQPAAQHGDFDPLFFDNALQGSLRHSALTLWLLGYPDQARARMEEALACGRQNARSIRYGMTLIFAAMLHHYLDEIQAVQLRAQEIRALATTYGFTYHLVSGLIFEGWVSARQDKSPQGTAQLRQNLEVRKASGHRLFLPYELGLLSEAWLLEGEPAEGLVVLEDALAVAAQTGEFVWQPELKRLQAELLLAQGAPVGEVEASYLEAVNIAHQQKARSLELRACISLARLWQNAGRNGEARELLTPIYTWFTEGFDTLDLQNARALLKELQL